MTTTIENPVLAKKWNGTARDAGHIIDWILNSDTKGLGNGRAQYLCRDGVCTKREEDHDLVVETADGHTIVQTNQWVVLGAEGAVKVVDDPRADA